MKQELDFKCTVNNCNRTFETERGLKRHISFCANKTIIISNVINTQPENYIQTEHDIIIHQALINQNNLPIVQTRAPWILSLQTYHLMKTLITHPIFNITEYKVTYSLI